MPLPPPAPLAPSHTPPRGPICCVAAVLALVGLAAAGCCWHRSGCLQSLGCRSCCWPSSLFCRRTDRAGSAPVMLPPAPQAPVTIHSVPAPDEHGDSLMFSCAQKVPVYLGSPFLSDLPGIGISASGSRTAHPSPRTHRYVPQQRTTWEGRRSLHLAAPTASKGPARHRMGNLLPKTAITV